MLQHKKIDIKRIYLAMTSTDNDTLHKTTMSKYFYPQLQNRESKYSYKFRKLLSSFRKMLFTIQAKKNVQLFWASFREKFLLYVLKRNSEHDVYWSLTLIGRQFGMSSRSSLLPFPLNFLYFCPLILIPILKIFFPILTDTVWKYFLG